jgi:hypothetical protein
MADEQEKTTISPQDIEAVAGKLQTFLSDLPEQEQNVLGWILTRAQSAGDADTSGYYYGNLPTAQLAGYRTPISSLLARSAGLGPVAGETEIGWKFKAKDFGASGWNVNPV